MARWTKEQLNEDQILIGLEAAYAANRAFDDIKANQEMIEQWQSPEQAAVSPEQSIIRGVAEWELEKETAQKQFSAFEAVAGSLIGRDAFTRKEYPSLSLDDDPVLTGSGLPKEASGTEIAA